MIQQTGNTQLLKYLETLPKKLVKRDLRLATRDTAKEILLVEAKRLAPQGETRRVVKSLTVRVAKGNAEKRLPRHIVGHSVTTRDKLFTGDTFYAGFLEFGTKERRTKVGESRGSGPEIKFLRNALYNNIGRITRSVREKLIRYLNETARQAGMPQ